MKIQNMFENAFFKIVGLAFLLAALNIITTAADTVSTKARTVTKISEGVYTIRHKDAPDTFPQSNTTVIIGDREVLVVDSCYLPSAAREDIAEIRQWTKKPVRYLVNTHWHYDHTMGNGAYWEAFTPLTIIAHIETSKQSTGMNLSWMEFFPKRAEIFKRFLESGKADNGKPLTDGERKEYAQVLEGLAPVLQEYKTLVDRHPNFTFTDEVNINLGNREVQIKHLGRGNTAGDAIVYLPQEKILVTGDLLVHPVPYLFGGYPVEFIKTLQKMSLLDAQIMIPGHGEVLRDERGKAYAKQVTDFLQTVISHVEKEFYIAGGRNKELPPLREAMLKNPEMKIWRQKFAGEDKESQDFFDTTLIGLVNASFAAMSAK
jgi:cyclase